MNPIPTGLDGRLRPAAPVAALGEDRRRGPGRCGGARRQRVGGVATGGRGCRDVILGPKIGGKPNFRLFYWDGLGNGVWEEYKDGSKAMICHWDDEHPEVTFFLG